MYPSPNAPTVTALNGLLYVSNVAEGDSLSWYIAAGGGELQDLGYSDSIFYFPTWGDVYYVEAINAYGCTTLSQPFAVDETIGVGLLHNHPLRLWRDADGRLQSSAPLAEVHWYDARGRRIAGPQGAGPWLVHARSTDGRTARQWVR